MRWTPRHGGWVGRLSVAALVVVGLAWVLRRSHNREADETIIVVLPAALVTGAIVASLGGLREGVRARPIAGRLPSFAAVCLGIPLAYLATHGDWDWRRDLALFGVAIGGGFLVGRGVRLPAARPGRWESPLKRSGAVVRPPRDRYQARLYLGAGLVLLGLLDSFVQLVSARRNPDRVLPFLLEALGAVWVGATIAWWGHLHRRWDVARVFD